MRIVAVVQARLSSRRLPGKVLMPLAGRPMIGHLFEALRRAGALDGIVLATSDRPDDDAVADFAREVGVDAFRGSLDDVAGRMLAAAEAAGADALVRVNGDSPLLDPALVDRAAGLYRAGGAAIVSNVRPRSFPKGQSVEVVSTAALRRAHGRMTEKDEREHVTPHLYDRPDDYPLAGFQAERPRPDLQLSVDEPEDFARCAGILARLDRPAWQAGWEACAALADDWAATR